MGKTRLRITCTILLLYLLQITHLLVMLLTSNERHYTQCSKVHIFLKAVTAVVPISSIFLGQFRLYSVLEVSRNCEFYKNRCRKIHTLPMGLKEFPLLISSSSTTYMIFGIKDRYMAPLQISGPQMQPADTCCCNISCATDPTNSTDI